jgi:hypothetical protein
MGYINRSLAFHDALSTLDTVYREYFDEPKLIPVHPEFAKWPGEKAWVMVREGYGAIGLCDALSSEQLKAGYVPCFGKFLEHELPLLDSDSRPVFFTRKKDVEG